MDKIELYDATNIDSLCWPETKEGAYANKFLKPLIKRGIAHYIDNIEGDLYALKIEEFVLPILVAQENYTNSHVCSSYGQYISYGRELVGLMGNVLLSETVKGLLKGMGKMIRAGRIDAAVYVNHWLFSTNLYPKEFSSQWIELITDFLQKRFPSCAIIFRSLNPMTNSSLMERLKTLGFGLIASRQVYLTDTKREFIFQTRIVKSDLKLYRESPYAILDEQQLCKEECTQLLKLYKQLYLDQHSYLNPQFNQNFIELLFQERLLHFKVLKRDGCIKAVAGYFEQDGIMLSPFFGYDKESPHSSIIYRLLSTSLLLEAQKKGLIFHQSSGANFYKTVRRAESHLDSMAIYTAHLPMKQKLSWSMLRFFINTFAPHYLKRY
jgi:hypothetical protein